MKISCFYLLHVYHFLKDAAIEFNAETNILTSIMYDDPPLDRDTNIESLTCFVLKLYFIYLCLAMAASGHFRI
jgi:hypothetical protein